MAYNAFLIAVGQMSNQKKSRVVIDNQLIMIEALPQKNRWNLLTKVFHLDGYIPPSIQDCFSSINSLRCQHEGSFLKLDEESNAIYFVKQVEMPVGKYIPFRDHMKEFITAANEWRETLDLFAQSDYVYKRVL